MAMFEIIMPKLGESIIEATITKWLKTVGDTVNEDDSLVEIATDKVDSEIPSPVEGILKKIFFKEGETVAVGKVIALIDMAGDLFEETNKAQGLAKTSQEIIRDTNTEIVENNQHTLIGTDKQVPTSARFYSPLVKNIAKKEAISLGILEKVPGTGAEGRLTKNDLINYLATKGASTLADRALGTEENPPVLKTTSVVIAGTDDIVVEMDRMRKLISDHMVMSKQVSPHVTSFHEVDATSIVKWRNANKDIFLKNEGEKLTFTPFFIEAAAKTLRDLPGVNASVNGYNVILRKNINIGMATALPNGNLIVPVIKNADQKNLLGLVKDVNRLAYQARNNKLLPDDIQGGTFTITNLGTFGSLTGTPIINQPQVAILGIGAIVKKPVVLETPDGDVIAIRHRVILSLSYDHRVVDGAMGGMFLKRMAELLEGFDINRKV
ncbi:MAG: 2-oxo acid dehydrogenase subunit E2 [Lentimicrobiaceae bacterium]|nr:2-oxo acid dehydrogenase subunit E2 [Lentimicrobiaceae bacterium]